MRRPRAVAAVLLALTFATGALAGMAVEEGLGLDWFDFLDEDARREEALLDGIRLSGTQREQVEEILDRQEDRMEEYWGQRLPELQGIAALSYDEIRAVLTPDQRAVFDRRLRERGAFRVDEPGD